MSDKKIRVIDASMSVSDALAKLEQYGMYAELYRVPQGDDLELAEAMRLLSGLGCVMRQKKSGLIVGGFEAVPVDYDKIVKQQLSNSCLLNQKVILVDFIHGKRRSYNLKDAVS